MYIIQCIVYSVHCTLYTCIYLIKCSLNNMIEHDHNFTEGYLQPSSYILSIRYDEYSYYDYLLHLHTS